MGCASSTSSKEPFSRQHGSNEAKEALNPTPKTKGPLASGFAESAGGEGSFKQRDYTAGIPGLSSTASSARWSSRSSHDSHRSLVPAMLSREKPRTEIEFDFLGEIGQGSYSCVYKAQEKKSGQILAIKRIAKTYVDEYVEQECLSLAKSSCDHIIRFKEVFVTEENVVMCMEYASEGSLFKLVEKEGRLSEDEARRLFQQLIIAIDYCNQGGVVIRLLLKNILLSKSEESEQLMVKVCDFGPVHPVLQNSEDKNFFTTNLADYGYDTPEFFMGRSVSTGDTDGAQKSAIWAAGVVLYTMVCGVHPFAPPEALQSKDSLRTINRNIVSGTYAYPKGVKLSAPLKELLSRIFQTEPNLRISVDGIFGDPWFVQDLSLAAAARQYILKEDVLTSPEVQKLRKVIRSANSSHRWREGRQRSAG